MNLGEKLKAANEARAQAANRAEIEKRERDAAKFKLDDETILNTLERVKLSLTKNIEDGVTVKSVQLPKYDRELFDHYQWKGNMVGTFTDVNHPHFTAFESFFKWADENGLVGKFISEHDGMGMESWYVATVEPK